tara:strand:+ start:296 stop:595 length:300 start_codon:yes stop_codon:yes gene_type:complete
MAKKKQTPKAFNKMYANDPQAKRYQQPRRVIDVLDASMKKNRKDADHYTIREVNPDAPSNVAPSPSDITKDAEARRLYDRLGRQEKMYGRFKKKNEREA